jgi:hypothetical protein
MSRNVIPPMIAVAALSPVMSIDLFTIVIRRFNSDLVFNQMVDMVVDTQRHHLLHPHHITKRDMISVGKASAMNIIHKRLSIIGNRMLIILIIEIIWDMMSGILMITIKQAQQILVDHRRILAVQFR